MSPQSVRRWGRGFMLAWDLLLVAAAIQVWSARGAHIQQQLGITAALIGLDLLWTWYWLRLRDREWWQGGVIAGVGLAVIAAVLQVTVPAGTSVVIFAAVVLGAGLRPRYGVPAALAAVLVAFAIDLTKGNPSIATSLLFNNILVALLAVGGRVFVSSYIELHGAREEIARLAVAEERLRFARDLHDTLGHSLAVIVLKGEVAARALPAESAPRRELGDIVAVARQALEQVREAVSGYRAPSLDTELANSRHALAQARVEARFENVAGRLPVAAETLFSWAVREGTTNVIRHSHAGHCRVRIWSEEGSARLEIENDGVRPAEVVGGNGLRGLEERARLLGGSVAFESIGGRFRLLVAVPATEARPLQPA